MGNILCCNKKSTRKSGHDGGNSSSGDAGGGGCGSGGCYLNDSYTNDNNIVKESYATANVSITDDGAEGTTATIFKRYDLDMSTYATRGRTF